MNPNTPTQSTAQPIQKVRREITDHNRRSSPQDALRRLERHGLKIKHAGLCARMDHRILTRNLVRRNGHILTDLLRVADDIQIRAGGLNHDNIGALLDIAMDGASREATASGRQLVAFPIAKGRTGAGGVAEWAVQTAGEFGGVGHEDDLVGDAGLDELELDGADAAVVHVGRGDAVGAGLGVGHGDVADAVDRQLVVEAAVVAQDAAVAVRRVFAEADVGHDEEVGEACTQEADGLDDGALWVVGCGAEGVFGSGGDGNAEEDDGSEAFADEGFEEGDDFVDAPAGLIGEGGDERFFFGLVGDEEWVDEHGLGVGLSVMAPGNRAVEKGRTFVNCLSACHDLVSGWLYPPCNWLDMSPDMLTLVAAVLA